MPPPLQTIAAFLGATGVGLGAMGAHALKQTLNSRNMMEQWKTASMYQMVHAAALLGISTIATKNSRYHRAGQVMALGTVMFSGSIYFLCLGIGPKKLLGPATPIGGMLVIGGWAMLAL